MFETVKDAITKDRTKLINSLTDAADAFYKSALSTDLHTWLELTGLMREMIKIYGAMLGEGVDPMCNSPRPKKHNMNYIAEKLDCIFGEAMRSNPELVQAFASALQMKGWPIRFAKRIA
jgi:hypothetical protein